MPSFLRNSVAWTVSSMVLARPPGAQGIGSALFCFQSNTLSNRFATLLGSALSPGCERTCRIYNFVPPNH